VNQGGGGCVLRRFFVLRSPSGFLLGLSEFSSAILALDQKGVGFALLADGSQRTVSGDNYGFIGQRQHRVVQGSQNLLHGAAGQIGAADGTGEKGVTGDEFIVGREIEADAAFGVAGRVQDIGTERSCGDRLSGCQAAIDFDFAGRGHAHPHGLRVEHFQKSIIILIEQDWCTGGDAEFHGSADVVDVSVGDDDVFDLQVVLTDESENVLNVVPRIDDHGFAGALVADDGAVALQGSDWEDFVDHGFIV
jgi:hypothetical protein